MLVRAEIIDVNPEGELACKNLRLRQRAYVLRPLCVADPLAKKRASMYANPPAGYSRIDPTMVTERIYRSVR